MASILLEDGTPLALELGGLVLLESGTPQGLGLHDIRMKNPDGQWVPIINHDIWSDSHTDLDMGDTLVSGSALVWDSDISKWRARNIYSVARYGGIEQTTDAALSDITASYQVLPANADLVTTPKGITQDNANNGISFDAEGVYRVSVIFTLEHNISASAARYFTARFYNSTDAAPEGNGLVLGVGRNDEASTYSVTWLAEIGASDVGDTYKVEVGNASANITGVTLKAYRLEANGVSEMS